MRTKIYVGVVFETDLYNYSNEDAKTLAESIQNLLENTEGDINKLIGAIHTVSVYDVSIQERVEKGHWNKKADT